MRWAVTGQALNYIHGCKSYPSRRTDISVFGLGAVAAITVLCYLAGTGVKTTPLDNKYIPVICGGAGLVLGLVALYAGMPEFPATDPITAAAVGVVSGLAATGINQAVKQLGKTE